MIKPQLIDVKERRDNFNTTDKTVLHRTMGSISYDKDEGNLMMEKA